MLFSHYLPFVVLKSVSDLLMHPTNCRIADGLGGKVGDGIERRDMQNGFR